MSLGGEIGWLVGVKEVGVKGEGWRVEWRVESGGEGKDKGGE